jgi:putative nucleotidyltransferase with HDIG domain
MNKKVVAYVWVVTVAAAAVFALLVMATQVVRPQLVGGAALMAFVGFISVRLSYNVQRGQTGSVAFIPNLTALVLYPSWVTVVVLAVSNALPLLLGRTQRLKLLFNISQFVLAPSVATFVYLGLGGESLQLDASFKPIAHSFAVVSSVLINTFLVAVAISLDQKKSLFKTWVEGNASAIVYDLIAIPFVYGFARAYVDWGAWGAGALLTLMIGLRTTYHSKYRLENTNRELLELFVQTVEFRDPYTSGHSQRVSRSSQIIAELLDLPPKQQDRVRTAALLHDVGKIHQVFGPILSKTGRLTSEERAVMELHPIKGAELVAKITDLQDLVPAVRHHHERWDGEGYPDRLEGDKIPLGARIITIADTIDAMITDRPYRKAMGIDEVRAELAAHSGKQFDPAICTALLASPEFSRLFDTNDSGKVRSVTGIFNAVRRRARPPAAA